MRRGEPNGRILPWMLPLIRILEEGHLNTTTRPKFRILGQRTPKVDAVDKITGRAQFGSDIRPPGMLVGKVLRSPIAHARIKSIDTSRAKALSGVKAVVTGKDLPDISAGAPGPVGSVTAKDYYSSKELLARDKVLYHGHPVAAVAAISGDVAEEALGLIDVQYEELPLVLDPLEAMKPGSALLHDDLYMKRANGQADTPSNVAEHLEMGRGDVDAGFEEADKVVERTFRT